MFQNKSATRNNIAEPNSKRRIMIEVIVDSGKVVREYLSARQQNILSSLGEIKGTILNCSFRSQDCLEDENEKEDRREA